LSAETKIISTKNNKNKQQKKKMFFQPKSEHYVRSEYHITLHDPAICCCLPVPATVLVNTSALTHHQNPVAISTHSYIIGNTNKQHGLSHVLV
jgi:hypothetical protein